jgi:hypothetical protein
MLACLLAVALALAAQDAAPDADALRAEVDALQQEMSAASDAFLASLPRDASGNYAATDEDWARDPVAGFQPKFLELGRQAGTTEAGAKALLTAMGLTGRNADKAAARAQQKEIAELLLERFASTPHMEGVAGSFAGLRYALGSAEAESLLRRTLEKATDPAVKAAATFALGQVLFDTELTLGETHMMGQPRTDTSPARALFESLQRDFPDSEPAQRAQGFLFELDHLQVGMVAPDIEAVDQDGKTFKLSDSRGKVVLLVFWGFW